MSSYDLIVIGGGPGGYPLAIRMSQNGWKVAVIEEDELGGTCLNWGCIPTKALLASAKGFHFLKHAQEWGLSVEKVGFSWEKVQARKNEVVLKLRQGIDKTFQKLGVDHIKGTACFNPNQAGKVTINGEKQIEGKRICLAVGSKPWRPDFFPQEPELIWTSDEAIHSTHIPESLLIIGGGVIGLELGQVFQEFGSHVTIVEMMDQILPGLDTAVAKRLLPVFKKTGLEIHLGKKVERLQRNGSAVNAVIAGQEKTFDRVLLAMGRQANLSVFSSPPAPELLNGRLLRVDQTYQTPCPNVFAIGDCIPGPMLAHRATYDACVLSEFWGGKTMVPDYRFVPSCVYTYPEVAWVGRNEEQLKAEGIAYKTGRSMFSANGKALASGEADGQIKTLAAEDGTLLGAVLWGPEVGNMIAEAVLFGQKQIRLAHPMEVIYPHPTLSEAFLESLQNAMGVGVHG
jgi:dihydrolipoamide dehydrogenase